MERMGAIYRCSQCGTTRQYGHCRPDTSYEPLLHCDSCQQSTRHRFVQVRERSQEEMDLRQLARSVGGR